MSKWRAFTASVLLTALLVAPIAAQTVNHRLNVPFALDRLPNSLNRLTGHCRLVNADGVETHGANIDREISGGRFIETVPFDMRRNTRAGSDEPARYYCHFVISGRTATGQTVSFASDGSQVARGWISRSTTIVAPRVYLPAAPGTLISRSIHGQFEKSDAPPVASSSTSECPCGCNVGASSGCSTTSPPPPPPAGSDTPAPAPSLRLPAPVAASSVVTTRPPVGLRAGETPPPGTNITTSRFAYTGTGAFN